MRPVDPRLVREARPARNFLIATVGLGVATTCLVLIQMALLAHVIAVGSTGTTVSALRTSLVALLVVVLARTATAYATETTALRAAATVKSVLRRRLVAVSLDRGPAWLGRHPAGELPTLATRGVDALDAYFARFLPQIALAVLVPVAVVARVAVSDWPSALIIAFTLPLIPLFMWLVGMQTRTQTHRQWELLERLGGRFLDVVEGLPTLKIFRRAKSQAAAIRRITDEHRHASMRTLRVAFLSALVLELVATLATAVVAVEVGLRLLGGHIPYETALLVLLLAPEAYLPLRNLGTHFHASVEGATVTTRILDLTDDRPTATADPRIIPMPDLRTAPIEIRNLRIMFEDRATTALDDVTLSIAPGQHLAVVGETGAGKSTLLAVLLRFAEPDGGSVHVGDVDLSALSAPAWRTQIGWVPQAPYLFSGTVADNIRLGRPDADDDAVRAAAVAACADEFVRRLPQGYATPVGERGARLSAGERQRIALARALLRDAPLLLLDEPTAHLDVGTARSVLSSIAAHTEGRTVIVVTHHLPRGETHPLVDRVVRIDGGRVVGAERTTEAVA